jgi:hypothetical protein
MADSANFSWNVVEDALDGAGMQLLQHYYHQTPFDRNIPPSFFASLPHWNAESKI